MLGCSTASSEDSASSEGRVPSEASYSCEDSYSNKNNPGEESLVDARVEGLVVDVSDDMGGTEVKESTTTQLG